MGNKKNILLLESITKEAFDILTANFNVLPSDTPFSGINIAKQYPIHGIVTRGKGDVNEALINACPSLEIIARCGVGLDNIKVQFAAQKGIKVVNAPGINADTVAEHTIALMLMLQRNLFNSAKAVKENSWSFRKVYQGDEIRGKTLGILGMGNIGKRVARLASVFGMNVIYWDKFSEEKQYKKISFEEILKSSDLISIHLPLLPTTKHLINADALSKMQSHTILINTARGEIIDESALINALQEERLGGFGGDVLATEPPKIDNPLLKMPNVLITPHSASLTATTYNEMCVTTANNVVAFLNGASIDEKYIFA